VHQPQTLTAVRIASTEIVQVKYGESTPTMTAVYIASTEIKRVKYSASTATMTAECIATEIKRVKYIASTATMIAECIASTETVRVKYGVSTATMTAVRIASTEIVRVKYDESTATTAVRTASTKFLGESPKMETYFAVITIIIIIIINLHNCVKSCRKNCGGKKSIMGKSRHRMEDVKMHLKSRVTIGFNWHALVEVVMNFQAQ
jgi:hypothetical protein